MTHTSQASRILKLLEDAGGEWVPLPRILSLGIGCHTKRIHELRKQHVIEIRDEWVEGQRQVAYRLVPDAIPVKLVVTWQSDPPSPEEKAMLEKAQKNSRPWRVGNGDTRQIFTFPPLTDSGEAE
jgi:hypothetical protein